MYYSFCTQCADKVQQVHCLPSHPWHRQYVETGVKKNEKTHKVGHRRGDIYLPRTWMNHLYYYWTLERGKEIEKVGARKKKKEAELSLYFSFLQRFSNVISMLLLLLLEVWLSKQREREREVETETPTERWLRDERTEGSREAETKWESRKEREPKRLHCCSTVESQRQLSHMSANRDGEWVKGIVGLFIDIKTTRFDCAETGEAVWKQVQDKDLLRNCLRSFTDGKNPPICFVFFRRLRR